MGTQFNFDFELEKGADILNQISHNLNPIYKANKPQILVTFVPEYSDTVRDSATENASMGGMDDFQNLGMQYFFAGQKSDDSPERGGERPSLQDLIVIQGE